MPSSFWKTLFDQLFGHYGTLALVVVVLAVPTGLFAYIIVQFLGLIKKYADQADVQKQATGEHVEMYRQIASSLKEHSTSEMQALTHLLVTETQQTEVLRSIGAELQRLSESAHRADEARQRDLVEILRILAGQSSGRREEAH